MVQVQTAHPGANYSRWLSIGVLAVVIIGGGITLPQWLPLVKQRLAAKPEAGHGAAHGEEKAVTGHEGHDHAGHTEENSLEISTQAQASIGLKLGKVALSNFQRVVTVPGIVIERRGRSKMEITAPLTGIVTHIYATEGEAVSPGMLLFDIRLTYEDLVQSQTELLRTAEELDVVKREVARLEIASKDGAIAGKTLLDRKYEQEKQEAAQRAQKQSLLLHGLSQEQVDEILKSRKLLGNLAVHAPKDNDMGMDLDPMTVLQIQQLKVERGQYVSAGDVLAVLADHTELQIEGEAFEQDAPLLYHAVEAGFPIAAILDVKGKLAEEVPGLKIKYIANRVESDSRVMHFYVSLPNKLLRDQKTADGNRFVQWQYKPGQRMALRIPVEEWPDRIVVPAEAVAQDGIENYVFRANGDHFDRQSVRIEYRDPRYVVIANDGNLFPGDTLALNGAQQMQVALKNKAGGGVDPHAGHNH